MSYVICMCVSLFLSMYVLPVIINSKIIIRHLVEFSRSIIHRSNFSLYITFFRVIFAIKMSYTFLQGKKRGDVALKSNILTTAK